LSHLGEYLIQCGRRTYHAKIGDFVFISKGIPHNYKSSSKCRKVLVISPAGLEKYFKEVANILRIGHPILVPSYLGFAVLDQ
jgi:quercetin dioxygenase-like cupin family protein